MSNKIFPTDTVAKSPIVAADLFLLADSADSNKVKDCTGAVINTFVRGAGGSIVMATGETIGIASGGNITFTDATVDLISLLGAAVKVGNGTPTQTQAAEDLYVEGKLEVDGIIYADAGLTVLAGQAITDGVFSVTSGVFTAIASLTVDDITLNGNAISSAGASALTIAPTAGQKLIIDGHWGFDGVAFTAETDANTTLTAYAGKNITIESVAIDGGVVSGVVSITDGTASWITNSLSGFTSISGTTLTDGVASLNSGSIAALVNVTLGSATVNAGVFSMIQGATASDPTFSITQTGNNVAIAQTVGSMNLTAVGEVVINEGSADVDFRVESNGNANMLFVDGGNDRVVVGHSSGTGVFNVVRDNATIYMDSYRVGSSANSLYFRHSHHDTVGTVFTTNSGDVLGALFFQGVNAAGTPAFADGAYIFAKQDGVAGATYVPTNIFLETYGTARNTNQLVLHNDGRIGMGTDAPSSALHIVDLVTDADTRLTIVGNGTGGASVYIQDGSNANYYANFYVSDASAGINFAASGVTEFVINESGSDTDFRVESDTIIQALGVDAGANYAYACNFYPSTDDTYYLGKNDDDTPAAWKGVIVKDTTNGKYYRVEVINGTITATDLTD